MWAIHRFDVAHPLPQARTILKIPVPLVHDWSATADNPVGAEFMIMEEAAGVQLRDVWDEMDPGHQLSVMRELVEIKQKMLSARFSR